MPSPRRTRTAPIIAPARAEAGSLGWLKPAVVLAMIVLATAACGAGGSTSTVTVTSPPTSGASAGADKTPTPKQEFAAFLNKVQPLRKKSNDRVDRCNGRLDSVDSVDASYSGWASAARCTRRLAKFDKRTADKLAVIVPPQSIRRVYLAYVRNYRSGGQIDADLSYTLTHRQFFAWDTFSKRWNAGSQVVANFRVAVIAYAAQHGFGVPGWVHHVGGK